MASHVQAVKDTSPSVEQQSYGYVAHDKVCQKRPRKHRKALFSLTNIYFEVDTVCRLQATADCMLHGYAPIPRSFHHDTMPGTRDAVPCRLLHLRGSTALFSLTTTHIPMGMDPKKLRSLRCMCSLPRIHITDCAALMCKLHQMGIKASSIREEQAGKSNLYCSRIGNTNSQGHVYVQHFVFTRRTAYTTGVTFIRIDSYSHHPPPLCPRRPLPPSPLTPITRLHPTPPRPLNLYLEPRSREGGENVANF